MHRAGTYDAYEVIADGTAHMIANPGGRPFGEVELIWSTVALRSDQQTART